MLNEIELRAMLKRIKKQHATAKADFKAAAKGSITRAITRDVVHACASEIFIIKVILKGDTSYGKSN